MDQLISTQSRRLSMPNKPLAIDLYCGLFQAEFKRCADAAINQFVACWAENPNHVRLGVACQSPRSVSFKFGAMRDFEDARFPTRFTRFWHIGVSAAKAIKCHVFELAFCLVNRPAGFVFSPCPCFSQVASGLDRAFVRTISAICAWRDYIEVFSTSHTIATSFCYIGLFSPAAAPNATLAAK